MHTNTQTRARLALQIAAALVRNSRESVQIFLICIACPALCLGLPWAAQWITGSYVVTAVCAGLLSAAVAYFLVQMFVDDAGPLMIPASIAVIFVLFCSLAAMVDAFSLSDASAARILLASAVCFVLVPVVYLASYIVVRITRTTRRLSEQLRSGNAEV